MSKIVIEAGKSRENLFEKYWEFLTFFTLISREKKGLFLFCYFSLKNMFTRLSGNDLFVYLFIHNGREAKLLGK